MKLIVAEIEMQFPHFKDGLINFMILSGKDLI